MRPAPPGRPTIVLAAGGTGGHLFPAEALARCLVEHGASVHLLTDRRADAFAAAAPGVVVEQIRAGRFGGGPLHAACGLAGLAIGIVQARRRLRRLTPEAVVGFGGYPSVPTMLAAAQLGCATAIHEQNAVLGRANRLLAPRAGTLATGFRETLMMRDADRARAVHTGNPVRPAIAAAALPYRPPAAEGPVDLLIVGGSQGARAFDETVPAALERLPEALRARLRVAEQARPEGREAVAAQLAEAGIAAEVESFFADMPARLARAQLVVCRAGASTVAELAASGRPAILVPYPYAADDHQTANARAFAGSGAGRLLPQPELNAEALAERLRELLGDPAGLVAAAAAARNFARDDAAERLATIVLGLAENSAAAAALGRAA